MKTCVVRGVFPVSFASAVRRSHKEEAIVDLAQEALGSSPSSISYRLDDVV